MTLEVTDRPAIVTGEFEGWESQEVLAIWRELGIDVVSGVCVLMFAHSTGFHKAHRWLRGLFGRLPA